MSETNRLTANILLTGFLIIFTGIMISRAWKRESNLRSVKGNVITQYQTHVQGAKSSYDAIILGIDSGSMLYGITDRDKIAFNYLKEHKLYWHEINILYDQNAYNEDENLTYHVYELSVDGAKILTMNESTHFYKVAVIIFIPFDILLIWYMFFFKHKNKQTSLSEY